MTCPLYRILVLTNLYPGGVMPRRGAFVANQVESMRRLGHTVEVVAIDGARSRMEYLRAIPRLRAALRTGRHDLVHAHYGPTGLIGRMQSRLPLLVTHVGSDLLWSRQRFLSRTAARLADFNLVMSRQMKEVLALPHCAVLPNGTDLGRFQPVPPMEARRQLGWPEDSFVVLFPADPARPEKNHPLAVEAVERARAAMDRAHRAMPIRLVEVYGRPQEEYNLALNAADLCLLTSRWEGSPNAVREALAVGLPLVSVPVGDAAEMLEGIPHCRVCYAEPIDLGDAIAAEAGARLASGGPIRHHGRFRTELFSVDRVALKLTRVYELLLSGVRDGARVQEVIDALDPGEPGTPPGGGR